MNARSMNAVDRRGWAPALIEWREGAPVVSWCYLGDTPLTDPFYEGTVGRMIDKPFNRLFAHRTDMDALARWAEASPGLQPSGFIFHLSRCGSTLISRMLAALPSNLVVSEAGPVDAIAGSARRAPESSLETRARWLRDMVSALGQRRGEAQRRYFIKFDSEAIHDLPLVRAAYPDVPWIFVYRDPVEVLASHLAQPAFAMIRGVIGAGGLDLPVAEILNMSDTEYGARVLARRCQSALAALRDSGLRGSVRLVNYTQLPGAVTPEIAPHFGLQPDAAEAGTMNAATRFHAKRPRVRFQPDGEHKRSGIPEDAREAVERLVRPLYDELERMRVSIP